MNKIIEFISKYYGYFLSVYNFFFGKKIVDTGDTIADSLENENEVGEAHEKIDNSPTGIMPTQDGGITCDGFNNNHRK